MYQRTLAKRVSITGIGIHSGKKVTLVLHPAEANTGIRFRRTDLENVPSIRASVKTVGATENNTTLGDGENSVHTVEHLLSVLYGLGIDNVLCEIDGPEVPIMDGSGASFVYILKETGITNLGASKKFFLVLKPVRVQVGDKWAEIRPDSSLSIESTIVFSHPVIQSQKINFRFSCEDFINNISRARTFGLLKDVDKLKRRGLAKGGSLDNCIVLDDFKVLNPEGLRFEDEFIRHKVLDVIGDISLLGHDIAGKIITYKSGHNLHNLLCKKLLDTPDAYEIVSASSLEQETLETLRLPPGLIPSFG